MTQELFSSANFNVHVVLFVLHLVAVCCNNHCSLERVEAAVLQNILK